MNKVNWPYIGPSILNNEMCVGVTAEAIVTSEDTETYTWVLNSMPEIETRWNLSQIKIIYCDGF